jgi:hypothetical protein
LVHAKARRRKGRRKKVGDRRFSVVGEDPSLTLRVGKFLVLGSWFVFFAFFCG